MATTLVNNMHIFSLNHANSPVVKYEEQPSPTDYYSDCTSDATVTTIPAATKEEKKTTSMQQDWSLDNQLCDHENTIMQSYLEPESIHSKSCINYVPSSPCSSTVSPHYCFRFSSIKSKMKKVFRFSSSVKLEKHQQQPQRSYHKEEEKFEDEEKKSITVCSSLPNLAAMNPSRAPSMDSVCTHSQRYHPVEKQGDQGKVTRIKKQFSRNSSVSDIAFSSPHHYNHHYHHQHHHHHEIPLPPLPPKGILKKNRSYYNRPMSAIEIASSQTSKQQQQQQQQQQLEKQTKTPPQRHSFLFLLNRRSHKTSISSTTVGRIRFNKLVSVHETWSKQDYDRGSDPDAVCTRLTSELAHHIKQELNFYKLHEMTVHDSSRINTHFFL